MAALLFLTIKPSFSDSSFTPLIHRGSPTQGFTLEERPSISRSWHRAICSDQLKASNSNTGVPATIAAPTTARAITDQPVIFNSEITSNRSARRRIARGVTRAPLSNFLSSSMLPQPARLAGCRLLPWTNLGGSPTCWQRLRWLLSGRWLNSKISKSYR